MSDQLEQYGVVGMLILAAAAIAGSMLLLPTLIGKKRTHSPVKDTPYECGLPPMQQGQPRFSVKFYVVAMLFILFDLEVVFMLGWGAVFRDLLPQMGWRIILGAVLFLLILEAGHIYLWKKGALDWAPARKSEARNSTSENSKDGRILEASIR